MSDVSVSIFAHTDIGMMRAGNEDSFLVADLTAGKVILEPETCSMQVGEQGSLLVVSDGMGGAAAGEIASDLAVKTICDALMNLPLELGIPDRLEKATEMANERIWEEARHTPDLTGMGATLTAVLVHGPRAYIAQVGDSRAYLVRGSQIEQVTKDQSLVQLLIEAGLVKPEQSDTVPQNVIMQALGTQPSVQVVLTEAELCRNDYLIICSDGLSNKFYKEEILDTIRSVADPQVACRRLIEMANERGGEDNITAIVARFDGADLLAVSDESPISATIKAVNEDYFNESVVSHYSHQRTPSPPKTEVLRIPVAVAAASEAEESPDAGAQETPAPAQESTVSAPEPVPEPQPVMAPSPLTRRRIGYRGILIFALISLLLLAMVIYVAYLYFSEDRQAEPAPADTATVQLERDK